MIDRELVSVIIPNYNHAPFLKHRIDSVLNQTYQNIEVIILDDSSTDNSRGIIEGYRHHPKIKHIIFNEENSGSPFAQWNKGVRLARGRYIWIAESDDYANERYLDEVLLKLQDEQVGLAYCQSIDVGEDGSEGSSRLYYTKNFNPNIWEDDFVLSGKDFLEFLKSKCVIPNVSACVFRKLDIIEVFNRANLPDFTRCGDWNFYIELCKRPIKIAFIAKPLNYFRESQSSSRFLKSITEKRTRILEELQIIKGLRNLFPEKEYKLRVQLLKREWCSFHNKSNLDFGFFSFCHYSSINHIELAASFFLFKFRRRRIGISRKN